MEPNERHAQCGLYTPGHQVHWIQARLARTQVKPQLPGLIVSVDDDVVVVATEDGVYRWLHHDMVRLRRAVDEVGPAATWVGYGLLRLSEARDGSVPMFHVRLDDGTSCEPCRPAVAPHAG